MTENERLREALKQIQDEAQAKARDHLEFGMEEIRRYSAANDLTDLRDLARAALATPPSAPRAWGPLRDLDPDGPMCAVMNGNILCCRTKGHDGTHATPFPSFRGHGPVWVFWSPGGPFGSCHVTDPATRLYCGLQAGHEGDHLAPTNERSGKTLAEWSASPVPASAPPDESRCTGGGIGLCQRPTDLPGPWHHDGGGEKPCPLYATAPKSAEEVADRAVGFCRHVRVGHPHDWACAPCIAYWDRLRAPPDETARLDAVRAFGIFQRRLQPPGSPPPGGMEVMAYWITESVQSETARLREALAALTTAAERIAFIHRYTDEARSWGKLAPEAATFVHAIEAARALLAPVGEETKEENSDDAG